MDSKIIWKDPAIPRSAMQVIPVTEDGEILTIYRGPAVRSARNVWSFPTGLHDIGETLHQCADRELKEEFNLSIIGNSELLGTYENIAPEQESGGPQYHWVMTVLAAVVNKDEFENREPDKHTAYRWVDIRRLLSPTLFVRDFTYHSSFEQWFLANASPVYMTLKRMTF
jgi:ADP-ribose pyrophosphatase YjhB (NUDIX family)